MSILLLGIIIALAQLMGGNNVIGFIGIGLLGLGGFLVAFGFWGADFAFSQALGELNQSKEIGEVRGERGKVNVPFIHNYTPMEWWNINWLVITIGVFCFGVGTYFIGFVLGRLGMQM
ncbi:MAG: hypothetical protein ABSA11_16920 [Candidatus Bathyarchaeia archaeon]